MLDHSWLIWRVRDGKKHRARSRFAEAHFGLQAVMSGQGLTRARSVLARDMVERGLLVPYRPDISPLGARYTALSLPERTRAKKSEHVMIGSWK